MFDPVHRTRAEQLETLGVHGPPLTEQVRVQGSLNDDEAPPARVYVDTRLTSTERWRPVLVMTPAQARELSARVVLVAELVGKPLTDPL